MKCRDLTDYHWMQRYDYDSEKFNTMDDHFWSGRQSTEKREIVSDVNETAAEQHYYVRKQRCSTSRTRIITKKTDSKPKKLNTFTCRLEKNELFETISGLSTLTKKIFCDAKKTG